jgi:hypothetical protein
MIDSETRAGDLRGDLMWSLRSEWGRVAGKEAHGCLA